MNSLKERERKLETEQTDAQHSLDSDHNHGIELVKELKDDWTRQQTEINEWSTLLSQFHLPEVQPGALSIFGEVILNDEDDRPVSAAIVLRSSPAGAEKQTSTDDTGRFSLYATGQGEQYTITAQSQTHLWTSLPMPLYFSASLSIYLDPPSKGASRWHTW